MSQLDWLPALGNGPLAALGLLPVCLFLLILVALDSFKLVTPRTLFLAIAAGVAAAGASYVVGGALSDVLDLDIAPTARYVAPLVEESLKAVGVVVLIRTHRIGFAVDAAVLGFAVGTGFALVENTYYFWAGDLGLGAWAIRGMGTAVMHGGCTSVYAMVTKVLFDRSAYAAFWPGFIPAYVAHSFFNHFLLPPAVLTGLILTVLPLLMIVVFYRSERATRTWLGSGFDADQALMEHLTGDMLPSNRIGRYLLELRRRFPADLVADMLCLIRLRAELSIKAKGLMMMRQAGFRVPPSKDAHDMLAEMNHLEDRIGPTGMLALKPVLRREQRRLWERHLLQSA